VIRDVGDTDEGVYTCRVRVVQLGTVEERHIKVNRKIIFTTKRAADFYI